MNIEGQQQTSQEQMSRGSKSKEQLASCMLKESCTLRLPIGKLWDCIKEFRWEKIVPSCVKSINFTCGSPKELGSEYKLQLTNGTIYTFRIVEISEVKRMYSMELIDSEPRQNFTSMLSTLKLQKDTSDNTTFFCWETIFSNDVTPDTIRCRKELIQSYFKDMKKLEH